MTLRWQATGVVDEKYGWNNLVNSASFVTPKESLSLWTTQMNSERSLGSVMNEEREIASVCGQGFWPARPVGG